MKEKNRLRWKDDEFLGCKDDENDSIGKRNENLKNEI